MDENNKKILQKPILELNSISKIYGNGVYANKNITFSVLEGEIHALVGENGAGKSTLMKILFGMEKADQGTIYINGKAVFFRSPQDAINLGIGMVHQHFKLVDSLSITENVIMGYEPVRRGFIDKKAAKKKVEKYCQIFNLKDDLDTAVGKLPVGTKQKIEIIKAMYRGAKILILDEPTAVLTPQETEELFNRLKDLKQEGFTVIFISHKLREVKELSDRVSVMRKGKMVATVNTKDVTEQEISALMVGSNYSKGFEKIPIHPGHVILSVKDVSVSGINKKKTVDNVSFTVRAGEIIGIAGVEGNGQSELVESITGLNKVEKGTICIGGTNVTNASIQEHRNLGMTYIPSDRMKMGLSVSMSIKDNLIATKLKQKFLYRKGFLSKKNSQKLAEQLIKEYQIKCDSPNTEVDMLSGGNMQKVVVAREFTQNAKLIIAEQPTRGIDIGAAKFIHEELIKRRNENCAVLLVSADLEELYQIADSILVMYNGKFSAYLEDSDSVSEHELGTYMLGVCKQTEEKIKEAYREEEKFVV